MVDEGDVGWSWDQKIKRRGISRAAGGGGWEPGRGAQEEKRNGGACHDIRVTHGRNERKWENCECRPVLSHLALARATRTGWAPRRGWGGHRVRSTTYAVRTCSRQGTSRGPGNPALLRRDWRASGNGAFGVYLLCSAVKCSLPLCTGKYWIRRQGNRLSLHVWFCNFQLIMRLHSQLSTALAPCLVDDG